jgi:hypothetical protein
MNTTEEENVIPKFQVVIHHSLCDKYESWKVLGILNNN